MQPYINSDEEKIRKQAIIVIQSSRERDEMKREEKKK